MGERGLEMLGAEVDVGQRRRRAERLGRGGGADPAGEPRPGGRDLLPGADDAFLEQCQRRPGGEGIGLRAASAAVGGVGGIDLQPGLAALLGEQVELALLVVAVEPASAVSRRSSASASRRLAAATSASRSKRAARACRLPLRVNSCIRPIVRMVMKSRVRLKRSAPSTGRLLMPSLNTGSGHSRAAFALSSAASAASS